MAIPKLKLTLFELGFWYTYDKPNGMDPKFITNYSWDSILKLKVSHYLRNAYDMGADCGYSWCRITGKSGVEFGCSDYTDGIFIWPEGLVKYLDQYNIELPEYFIKKVIERNFMYHNENIKILSEPRDAWVTDPLERDPNYFVVDSKLWEEWSIEKKKNGVLKKFDPVWPK